MWGTCALLACLGAGSAYQQPPLRGSADAKKGPQAPLLEREDSPKLSPLKLAEEGLGKGLGSAQSSLSPPPRMNSLPRNGHKEALA